MPNEVLTLADLGKAMGPNDRIAKIIDILSPTNEIMEDLMMAECNDGTTHLTTVLSGYPEAVWRMLNYGVPRTKATTAKVRDATGMLEIYSECDASLADLSGDVPAFRLTQSKPIMAGMSKQVAETIFYGNTRANPERFLGLAPRFSSLSAGNGENIIDAGGVGTDNTSIWLIGWGEETFHCLYPKGSQAGLKHTDKGQQTLQDAEGNQYEGYRDHFKWDIGQTLRDWRYVVRIANIDVSLLLSDTDYLKALLKHMINAEEQIPTMSNARFAWYGNKTIRSMIRHAVLEKISNNLTEETVAGKRVTMFDGIPFRRCDALINNEARVV